MGVPSDKTIVEPVYGNMPLFGIAQTEDIIRSYRLSMVGMVVWKFLHTKYGMIETEVQSSIQGLCS